MKAIIATKYGAPDVLNLHELAKPEPKENEVLIRIKVASATTADTLMRKGKPLFGRLFIGLTKPKHPITGTGFSGVVEAIGKNVTQFKVGNVVFGESTLGAGTNAEYLCVQEDGVVLIKPEQLSHDEAATMCDGPLTSWNFLKEIAQIKKGDSVLINGASGSLGTAAVQLAKHLGAKITAVCSTSNLHMVKSLGADTVIDYTKTDFTKTGQSYDIIFDTIGKRSFSQCKKALTKNGTYISPVLGIPLLFQMLWTATLGRKKAKFSATGLLPVPKLRNLLNELVDIATSGSLKSVIDKRYPLDQVAEAHKYIETGRKKGNVIIVIHR